MRTFLILPLSAILLGGCLTSQENPNYEYSTTYRGDNPGQNQYASAGQAPASISGGQFTTPSVSIDSPEAQAIFASTGATDPSLGVTSPAIVASPAVVSSSVIAATAPTDAAYGAGEVIGTPGFIALQQSQQDETLQAVAPQAAAPNLPAIENVNQAPNGAAGTPIDYDYSRNIIAADAVTTHQQIPDTVRTLKEVGQTYTVQPGDTVYSLARKTCVGVNVIQSMNGLNTNYAINIGQSLRLPQSVC